MEINQENFSEWTAIVEALRLRQEEMRLNGEEPIWSEEGPATQEERNDCLKRWGVPERILQNIKEPEQLLKTKAIEAVSDFVKQPREAWCLVLSGGKGIGKSTAAAYWLHEVISSEHRAKTRKRYWWTGTRIARSNGYSIDYDSMLESQYMVIDDLGIEYLDKNGNFLQRLDELIDERYSNYRRTIITTNLNSEEFKGRYGERVSDRLRSSFSSGGAFIEIPDASLRGFSK